MGKLNFLDVNSWTYAGGASGSDPTNTDAGYGIIEIFPSSLNQNKTNFPIITGVMKDELSLNFDSEWTTMDSIDIPFISDTIEEAGKVIGAGTMLAGGGDWGYIWKSKKIWKQSGYIKVGGTFVVVDWEGDGAPLKAARNIIRYCTPGGNSKTMAISQSTNEAGLKAKTAAVSAISTGFDRSTGTIADSISNNLGGITDFVALKDAPPIVTIKVSKYFVHNDMVINSVTTKFSKEVSDKGPLSVEITFEAESRSRTSGFYRNYDPNREDSLSDDEKDDIGLLGMYGSRVKQGTVQ